MSLVNIAEPRDENARADHGFPPLVGEWSDLSTAWSNFFSMEKLCRKCRGTGNELFSMYKKCVDCGGGGVSLGSESTDTVSP